MRVIATLTTTPDRQNDRLGRVLQMLQHEERVDEIWLQLPRTFRRRPEMAYTPGPATKRAGAAQNPDLRDDDVLLVTDDDVWLAPAAV